MHTYTPLNSIFDGLTTNIHSILYILIKTLLRAHAKGQKSHKWRQIWHFFGRFPSDGATSVAEKGLIFGAVRI